MRARILDDVVVVVVAVLTLFGSVSAMALSIVKTRIWAAQTCPNGDNYLPLAGVAFND